MNIHGCEPLDWKVILILDQLKPRQRLGKYSNQSTSINAHR